MLAINNGQEGFWFGNHWIRIVRDFTTEAGTVEDFGFVANDIAEALEMQETRNAHRGLDTDQKGGRRVPTPGGIQPMIVVSESGLYDVVMRSNKPEGKVLRNLVTRQILPQLRKTGTYSVAPVAPVAALPSRFDDTAAAYLRMASALQSIGVSNGLAYAQAFTSIEKATGLPIADMRLALPAPDEGRLPYLNPTGIGRLLGGEKNPVSPRKINQMLVSAGLQVHHKYYQITEKGKEFGSMVPYAAGTGHSGYQALWFDSVVDFLRANATR